MENVSWTMFIGLVSAFTLVYYAGILFYYFRKDIRYYLHLRTQSKNSPLEEMPALQRVSFEEVEALPAASRPSFFESATPSDLANIELLLDRIKESLSAMAHGDVDKLELLTVLRQDLQSHLHLKDTPFRSAIQEMITSECEKYDVIAPSEEEMDGLWLRL